MRGELVTRRERYARWRGRAWRPVLCGALVLSLLALLLALKPHTSRALGLPSTSVSSTGGAPVSTPSASVPHVSTPSLRTPSVSTPPVPPVHVSAPAVNAPSRAVSGSGSSLGIPAAPSVVSSA